MERDGLQKKSIECVLLLIWIRPGCKGDIVDLHSDTGIPTGANKAWEKQSLIETFCETPKDEMAISGIYIWNPTCHDVLGVQVQGVKPS